ncbi:hypothetical protein CNMCM5793_000085 [Aspergillus hiratsukae]|uniref:hydroxyacylglutathione hydrolase n=1 Tax=Aspergillus hiratsukae TaxID=1194566 RepID=A0A8H6UFS1_9EURO|nr:hypothetical protein CNMCM5793_000085 [Aspergillus hiratsukae]
MAKVLFTPWKDHSQLLTVRRQFYPPPDYNGPDLRSKACATVGVWKLRGNLPHPVEATALLTDAILHDDAQRNSIFSIRATYSAAFCRFVTGLVDSKLHGQRKTMFQRAIDLGLPASFVELRHEATHRELPSLVVLRNATQRSLEWLWDYYWAKTDSDVAFVSGRPVSAVFNGADHANVEEIRSVVRAALEDPGSQGDLSEPPRKKRKSDQHSSILAAQLVAVCKVSRRSLHSVSRVLIEDSIVPKERKLGDSMDEAYTKWDKLLQTVAAGHPAFLLVLTEELVNELAFTSRPNTKNDPQCEAIYMWLDHILNSAEWSTARQSLSLAYILTVCEQNSDHWLDLLKVAVRSEDSGLPPTARDQSKAPARSQKKSESTTYAQHTEDDLQGLQKFGWERTGKGNNYAYLVTDEPTKESVIIDPANPPEVAPELDAQINAGKIKLTAIVNTHHHWDHSGGNDEMLKHFGKLPVIGGKKCQSVTRTPAHGETFKIGERISVKALHTPCHTQDSICYYMQDGDEKVVFTGDTLFIAGCGRFFEGNAQEMHKALNETLASLPDDTKVYPGHEYTKSNVKFCLAVSQSEPIKKLEAYANQHQQTQGKFTIGDEKLHNVFMRVNDPEIQRKTGKTDPVEVMAALREMKNAMDTLRQHVRARHKEKELKSSRTVMACSHCRSRRTRCDGRAPCEACSRRGVQCSLSQLSSACQGNPKNTRPLGVDSSINEESNVLQYIEIYFEKFHPAWPFLHRATFEPSQEPSILLQSVVMMGMWMTGDDELQCHAVELHDKLSSLVYEQRDKWAGTNSDSEVQSPWPMATYQGILLQIIFAFLKDTHSQVDIQLGRTIPTSFSRLVTTLTDTCLRKNMFFYPEILAQFSRDSVPDVFIWVGIEEVKRFALALYKVCKSCHIQYKDGPRNSPHSTKRGSLLTLSDLQFALPDSDELWHATSDLAARLAEDGPLYYDHNNAEANWISQDEDGVPGGPRTTKSRVLDGGASMVQDFTPVKQICAHLNAFHVYATDPTRSVEANHYYLRQCLLYDSTKPNARLIGIEYMISPRLFETLPSEERKLWHTHEFEVKSGMLIMPAPSGVPKTAWDAAEQSEMRDIVGLYGKAYHFWQVDRGDPLPLGVPQLMGSFTNEERARMVHPQGLDGLLAERDKAFGVDYKAKRERRKDIDPPDLSPDADNMWKISKDELVQREIRRM